MIYDRLNRRGGTHSQVTGLAAVIASTTGASAAQTESRAVSLNVAETLAMVALLGFSGTRERAAIGLVARLLACMFGSAFEFTHESSEQESYSCSRVAQPRNKPQRSGQHCHTCSKHVEKEKTFSQSF